jgi:hypothetical protein
MIRADKAYYLTCRVDVVGEESPARSLLICRKNEPLDEETARRVGLIEDEPEADSKPEPVDGVRTQAVTPPKKKTCPATRKKND